MTSDEVMEPAGNMEAIQVPGFAMCIHHLTCIKGFKGKVNTWHLFSHSFLPCLLLSFSVPNQVPGMEDIKMERGSSGHSKAMGSPLDQN